MSDATPKLLGPPSTSGCEMATAACGSKTMAEGSVIATRRAGGLGLVNLRRRAEKLHGTLVVESPETGGTILSWSVPVANFASDG